MLPLIQKHPQYRWICGKMAGVRDNWVRSFTVTDPTTHEKGFTVYKVTYKAFSLNKPEEILEIVVWKRYNDFKKLHKSLSTVYFNLRQPGKFPDFAKAKIFGRFDERVIEERRKSALDLLEFTSKVPLLAKSPYMKEFFQGGDFVGRKAKESSILQPSKIEPCPIHGEQNAEEADTVNTGDAESSKSGMEKEATPVSPADNGGGEGETPVLGGVWLHRQDEEEIEDSPEEEGGDSYVYDGSDDDRTTFSEDSLPTTPLPQLQDLSVFDPLTDKKSPSGPTSPTLHTSNSWLFHAMDLCADLKGDSPDNSQEGSLANSSTDLSSDSGITLQLPRVPDASPLDEPDSSQSGEPAVLPVSQDLDFSNAAKRGLSRDQRSSMAQAYLRCIKAQEAADRDARMDGQAGIIDSREETPNPSPQHGENRSRTVSGDSISKLIVRGEDDYLFKAARSIGMALQNEANGYYQAAFDSYKAGVSILLNGVAGETNKTRREAVRKKTAQYLMRAEDVYNNYLSDMDNSKRWESEALDTEMDPSSEHLRGSVDELKNYKVLGVVDKVMLVLDMTNYQTFIIKVLNKCAVADEKVRTCIPSYCPHMVRLCRFIESDISIYLVLEYASGGKLWDYVSPYLNQDELDSQKLSPTGIKVAGTRSQSPQSPRTKSLSGNDSELPVKKGDSEVKKKRFSKGEETPSSQCSDNLSEVSGSKSDIDGTVNTPGNNNLEAGPQDTGPKDTVEEINWLSTSPLSSKESSEGSCTPVQRISGDFENIREEGLRLVDAGEGSGEFDIVDEGESLNDLVEKSSSYQTIHPVGLRDSAEIGGTGVTPSPPRFTLFSIDSVESPTEAFSTASEDKAVFGYANGGTHPSHDDSISATPPSTENGAEAVIKDALEVIHKVNKITDEDDNEILEQDIFYNDQTRHVNVVDTSGFAVADAEDDSFTRGTSSNGITETYSGNQGASIIGPQDSHSETLHHLGEQSLDITQEAEYSNPSENRTDQSEKKRSSKWDDFFKLNETEEMDRVVTEASKKGEPQRAEKDKHNAKGGAILSEDELNVCVNPFEFDATRVVGNSEAANTWVTVDDPDKPRRTSVEVMKEWPSSQTSSSHSTPSHQEGRRNADHVDGSDHSNVESNHIEKLKTQEKGRNEGTDKKRLLVDQSNKIQGETESKTSKTLPAAKDTTSSTRRDKRLPSLTSLFSYLDDIRKQQGSVYLPESCVRIWTAEIIVAVSSLHACGIICRDLNPVNILLAQGGHIRLTFFSQWKCIKPILNSSAVENYYVAPEVQGLHPLTSACDWWSIGVLLFELLTGKSLRSCHPCGISTHTELVIPSHVSNEGRSLLKQLIQPIPHERLGAGRSGVDEIRSHPFFAGVDWYTVKN